MLIDAAVHSDMWRATTTIGSSCPLHCLPRSKEGGNVVVCPSRDPRRFWRCPGIFTVWGAMGGIRGVAAVGLVCGGRGRVVGVANC